MSKGWDSGMLKKLKALVGKGLSTSEMGKKLGMSKNAVVGKLNRLGWNAKATEAVDKKSTKTSKTKSAPSIAFSVNKMICKSAGFSSNILYVYPASAKALAALVLS